MSTDFTRHDPTLENYLYNSNPFPLINLSNDDLGIAPLLSEVPVSLWNDMQRRYKLYYQWFTGEVLANVIGTVESTGEKIYQFPLGVNPVRDFSHIHAAVLVGEHNSDYTQPYIRSRFRPRFVDEDSMEPFKVARFMSDLVNSVLMDSDINSVIERSALTSQYMGGWVAQLIYDPTFEGLMPLRVRSVPVQNFYCTWSSDNYDELTNVWVVYRLTAEQARTQYGFTSHKGARSPLFVEHWTKESYSVTVDNEPIVWNGVKMKDVKNPFPVIPFFYIPRIRSDGFYGLSLVSQIHGLMKEYNSRLADYGQAVKDTTRPILVVHDAKSIEAVDIDEGIVAYDMGMTTPAQKVAPEMSTIPLAYLNQEVSKLPKTLFDQMMRSAQVSSIGFGQDEGSQRSSRTLSARMWPTTSITKTQRTHWTRGFNEIAKLILFMYNELKINIPNTPSISRDWHKFFTVGQDWLPQIPRDSEQLVSNMVLLKQSGLVSARTAIESLGYTPNWEVEAQRIRQEQEEGARITMDTSAQDAAMEIKNPVASPEVDDSA